MSSASLRRSTSFGSTVATVVPSRMTVISSDTLQHLVELVGDEDDRGSVGDELVKRDEQLVDLLRDEHRGRLVEDQHLGAAVEHLEDLDPLSLPDPERGHECIEVDVGADRPRQLGETVLGLAELQHTMARPARRRG